MAVGTHPELKIGRGDTVVLSSRMIPGNEREITRLVNQIYRCGAAVVYDALEEVHVSGHGHRDELKSMLSMTRPKHLLPIHGEYRHLVLHAELATEAGVDLTDTRVVENGAILEIDPRGLRVVGAAPSGRVLVDPRHAGGIDEDVLADRLEMAKTGVVVVIVAIAGGQVIRGPEVFTRGMIAEEHEPALSRRAATEARATLDAIPEAARDQTGEVAEQLRRSMRRFFNKEFSQKPFVVPLVLPM
jgi:ribonuclease J